MIGHVIVPAVSYTGSLLKLNVASGLLQKGRCSRAVAVHGCFQLPTGLSDPPVYLSMPTDRFVLMTIVHCQFSVSL